MRATTWRDDVEMKEPSAATPAAAATTCNVRDDDAIARRCGRRHAHDKHHQILIGVTSL
jgi:hypothetical protein